jgi:hypothetical protein
LWSGEYETLDDIDKVIFENQIRLLGNTSEAVAIEKILLSSLTDYATSHGAETENPFPEPLTEKDKFLHFSPDVKNPIEQIVGARKVVDKIKELRKNNSLININPIWPVKLKKPKMEEGFLEFEYEEGHKNLSTILCEICKKYPDKEGEKYKKILLPIFLGITAIEKKMFQPDFILPNKSVKLGEKYVDDYLEKQIRIGERKSRFLEIKKNLSEFADLLEGELSSKLSLSVEDLKTVKEILNREQIFVQEIINLSSKKEKVCFYK